MSKHRINYNKTIPEDSFIGRYMALMSDTETASSYDFWCACWVLTSVIGRYVRVDRPRAPVYLNWFLILVAESATTRKSSAVRMAHKILRGINGVPSTSIISSKTTVAKLEKLMHEMTVAKDFTWVRICISEMVTFLGRDASSSGMPGLLTDLYDCPEHRYGAGTIARGETHFKDVFVSMLTASTPSWLIRAINPDIIEGGFTSRTMFICDEKAKKRIAWSSNVVSEASIRSLQKELETIRDKAREYNYIKPTESALRVFKSWYKLRKHHQDPFRNSFEGREDAHVLRMAATLCINDGSWVISPTHVKLATKIVAEVKFHGHKLFSEREPIDSMLLGIDKLRTRLLEAGNDGITQNQLRYKVQRYLDSVAMLRVLHIMHELTMVDRFETGTGRRKTTLWRATNRIIHPKAIEAISLGLDGGIQEDGE